MKRHKDAARCIRSASTEEVGGRLVATSITLPVAVWISLTEPSLDSKWLCDSLPAHCQDSPVLASLWQGY